MANIFHPSAPSPSTLYSKPKRTADLAGTFARTTIECCPVNRPVCRTKAPIVIQAIDKKRICVLFTSFLATSFFLQQFHLQSFRRCLCLSTFYVFGRGSARRKMAFFLLFRLYYIGLGKLEASIVLAK